jgi:hypothetical protein
MQISDPCLLLQWQEQIQLVIRSNNTCTVLTRLLNDGSFTFSWSVQMRAIDTSVAEPSMKTRLKKVRHFSKDINLKRSCLFLKNRRMSCHVEHFSHHVGWSFDKKYPKMTLLDLLPNITLWVFFYEETHFEWFPYRKVDDGPCIRVYSIVPTSSLD